MDEVENNPSFDSIDLRKDTWVVKPVDSDQEEMSRVESLKNKESALRAVMDGVAPGIIYDPSLLSEVTDGIGDPIESLLTDFSLTTFKDNKGNPIYEIVINRLNHNGNVLSERAIGYIIKKVDQYDSTGDNQPLIN